MFPRGLRIYGSGFKVSVVGFSPEVAAGFFALWTVGIFWLRLTGAFVFHMGL